MSDYRIPKLFSCCIIVKGASRSIVCDLQRHTFEFIQNDFIHIVENSENFSMIEIREKYPHLHLQIDSLYQVLEKNEYIFFTDMPDMFPKINISKWDEPSIITNAIVDIDSYSNHNWEKIFYELNELGCRHIQLRTYIEKDVDFYYNILSLLHSNHLYSIELYVKFIPAFRKETLEKLVVNFPFIQQIVIHSSNIYEEYAFSNCRLLHVKEEINSESHCGVISPDYFTLNIKSFSEAQQWNTCLNRKVAIDKFGEIKNCPSMTKGYGNINDISINEIVNNSDFQNYWKMKKDDILICRDCEFRYLCIDCRAYIVNLDNNLSKPIKCGYDPYTNQGFPSLA